MSYERLDKIYVDGQIWDGAAVTRIDDTLEAHSNIIGDIYEEKYIDVSQSSNIYNEANTPSGSGECCYQAFPLKTGYIEGAIYNTDNEGVYIDSPPPLSSGANNIAEYTMWSAGLTHYIKVEKGKTYLFKSNIIVTQTNSETNVSYNWGYIKHIYLDTTGGKRIWETREYNANTWNGSCEGYGMETGYRYDTYYGTTYAKILDQVQGDDVSTSRCYQAYLIRFNIDGWVRVVLGSDCHPNVYGTLPSSDANDKMTEETFRTILENFQVTETESINAEFEPYWCTETERIEYSSELTKKLDDVMDGFVETPYYSNNLYSNIFFTNNNQYINHNGTKENWDANAYDVKNSPLSAGMGTRAYGKNLTSGWVKLTTAGKYTIQQFKQIVDDYSGSTFGYIGVVMGCTPEGILVFNNTPYSSGSAAIVTSEYFNAISSTSQNMTKYTFEKLTNDEMYICWFMANFQDTWPTGKHFPNDTSYPMMSNEEMSAIKDNTMLSFGNGYNEFEEYAEGPIGYSYLIGIDSVNGLRSELDSLNENSTASSAIETITVANSDKIGFFGNSYFQGYTLEGQHPIVHLGSWSDYVFYNYSKSGDSILDTLERLETNNKTQYFSPFDPSEFNLTYAVIPLMANNGTIHSVEYEALYEGYKKVAKYLSAYGAKCILGTEHNTNLYYYNMMRLAREEGYMFMDWGQLASCSNPAGFKPFAHSGHPATRGHWAWTYGMKDFLDTLPRPRKSIKLFNARNSESANDDLLYNTNIERAKVWQDFSGGYVYHDNPQYFDRLCETELGATSISTKSSEYMSIHNGDTVSGKSKVLAEIITPYSSSHLNKIKVCLDTTADKIYIKRNTSLSNPITTTKYLAFGIGDNDASVFPTGGTLEVAAGSTGSVTGSTIEGTYIIDGVINDFVITTTISSGKETSGTDILEASVDGTTILNLSGSYQYYSTDFVERLNKPLCEWEAVVLDSNNCFIIENSDDAKRYFDFDKVSFLLESSASQEIVINDIYATVSGDGEKNRENHHKILKPIVGTSLLQDVDFATNATNWAIYGESSYPEKLTYTQTSGSAAGTVYTEYYPSGTESIIQIESGTRICRNFTAPVSNPYTAPMVQVRIVARRLCPVCFTDDDYNNNNVITSDYYPCGTLKVGFGDSREADCDYFGAIEVGLHWNLFIFNVPFQRWQNAISIQSESDWMQIARIEIDQIDNYITFS